MDMEQKSSGYVATGPKGSGRKALRLMRRMPIGRKLGIMAASMLVPLIALLTFYVYEMQSGISVTKMELAGVEWFQPLEEMMGRISDHSASSVTQILKPGSEDKGNAKFQAELDQWIATMDGLDAKYGKADDNAAWKAI